MGKGQKLFPLCSFEQTFKTVFFRMFIVYPLSAYCYRAALLWESASPFLFYFVDPHIFLPPPFPGGGGNNTPVSYLPPTQHTELGGKENLPFSQGRERGGGGLEK